MYTNLIINTSVKNKGNDIIQPLLYAFLMGKEVPLLCNSTEDGRYDFDLVKQTVERFIEIVKMDRIVELTGFQQIFNLRDSSEQKFVIEFLDRFSAWWELQTESVKGRQL